MREAGYTLSIIGLALLLWAEGPFRRSRPAEALRRTLILAAMAAFVAALGLQIWSDYA